jgi:uncharacterized protein involved in cysteine biosynthesis
VSRLGEAARGARALFAGAAFLVRTPATWGPAVAPAAIAIGVGAALAAAGLWAVASLVGHYAGSWLGIAIDVVLGVPVVFVSAVIALAVAQPLARGALDRIVRRMEEGAGVAPRAALATTRGSIARSIAVAAGALGVSLPTLGVLELVTVLAPELAPLTESLAFAVAALAFAWDLLDHPMSRRGLAFRDRLAWARANWAALLGFAVAAQVVLLVPGVDLLFLPIGVAGATKLIESSRDPQAH